MPTYEYKCVSQGHVFEVFQSINASPVDRCPLCGGPARRVISGGGGILFKGSGFFLTDYRSENYRKAAAADGAAEKVKTKTDGD